MEVVRKEISLALGDGPEALEMLRRGDGLKIQLLSSGKEVRA
jgi:hypothetical protein